MKKVFLLASGLMMAALANAGDNNGVAGVTSMQKAGKGIISNGFYLHLGLGFPSITTKSFDGYNVSGLGGGLVKSGSMGIQPSLEIGNQWYFTKNDKMGFGLKVSWFQFGFSTKTYNYNYGFLGSGTTKYTTVDLRFVKVAPQFTYAMSDEMAIDGYVEVSPTVMFIGMKSGNTSSSEVVGGVLFAPGLRFRYRKFAVGTDFSFGNLSGPYVAESGADAVTIKEKVSVFRLYAGFKF